MYDAITVAKHIIDYSNSHNCGISNLKLQKVLYFVQAEFLVSKPDHSPCFTDAIEAWDFGPVVPTVYHKYKVYGRASIHSSKTGRIFGYRREQEISDEDQKLIDNMVDKLKDYSASALVSVTHAQDPWKNAYICGHNNKITNQDIRKFFGE